MKGTFYGLILVVAFFISCSDSDDSFKIITIEAYMDANGITDFDKTDSGLYYKITDEGTGEDYPVDDDIVQFQIEVYRLDDTHDEHHAGPQDTRA